MSMAKTTCTCGVGNVWGDQQAERAHSPSCPFRQEMLARSVTPKDPWVARRMGLRVAREETDAGGDPRAKLYD